MKCIPEIDNPYDRWAVQVKAPDLQDLPVEIWDRPTREDGSERVRDIAGQIIGRVPRYVCNVIHIGMMVHRNILNAGCVFTGNIIDGGPVPGGGPALEAMYLLEVVDGQDVRVADGLRQRLQHEDIWL